MSIIERISERVVLRAGIAGMFGVLALRAGIAGMFVVLALLAGLSLVTQRHTTDLAQRTETTNCLAALYRDVDHYLREALDIVRAADMPVEACWVRHHHERFDGGGYPDGLAGESIPLESRIILVADAFEAMTSDRPYRNAPGADFAVGELRKHAGTQFDPEVVEALCRVLDRGARARGRARPARAPRRGARGRPGTTPR